MKKNVWDGENGEMLDSRSVGRPADFWRKRISLMQDRHGISEL